MGRGPARTLLVVSTFFCSKELIVHYDILLVVAMYLFRGLCLCRLYLMVRLERATAFEDRGLYVTWTSWDGCGRLESVVNQIRLSISSFTTSMATSSILSKLESRDLAWKRPFLLVLSTVCEVR